MEEIANYAQVTTVAVIILVVMQVLLLAVATALGLKLYFLVKRVSATAKMSKDFMVDLREQQIKNSSIARLGMFAFKNFKKIRKYK